MNLGVLASHEGTTLQSVLDACATGRVRGRVSVVISNNGNAGALVRARAAGIPAYHLSSKTHSQAVALDAAIVDSEYDSGPVVRQCRVPVHPGDSLEDLKSRVRTRERDFAVETLAGIADGQITLAGAAETPSSRHET